MWLAALRCISGGLVTDGRQMACLVVDAFAAFSVDPPPAPAATAEVCQTRPFPDPRSPQAAVFPDPRSPQAAAEFPDPQSPQAQR